MADVPQLSEILEEIIRQVMQTGVSREQAEEAAKVAIWRSLPRLKDAILWELGRPERWVAYGELFVNNRYMDLLQQASGKPTDDIIEAIVIMVDEYLLYLQQNDLTVEEGLGGGNVHSTREWTTRVTALGRSLNSPYDPVARISSNLIMQYVKQSKNKAV